MYFKWEILRNALLMIYLLPSMSMLLQEQWIIKHREKQKNRKIKMFCNGHNEKKKWTSYGYKCRSSEKKCGAHLIHSAQDATAYESEKLQLHWKLLYVSYARRIHQSSNYVCETSTPTGELAKANKTKLRPHKQDENRRVNWNFVRMVYTVNGMSNAAHQSSIICLFDRNSRFVILLVNSKTDLLRFRLAVARSRLTSFNTLHYKTVSPLKLQPNQRMKAKYKSVRINSEIEHRQSIHLQMK